MALASLHIHNFRIIDDLSIDLSPGVNLFYGNNGSGKSSIIEAAHCLARGKSFRTSKTDTLIQQGKSYFCIRAALTNRVEVACQRQAGSGRALVNGSSATMLSVASKVPAIFMDSDSHRLFFSSPSVRRSYVDWVLFHVKPGYADVRGRYNKALKSRNSALKAQLSTAPWDPLLADLGDQIISSRRACLNALFAHFHGTASVFNLPVDAHYQPSVEEGGLLQALKDSAMADKVSKITQKGPHRDDIVVCGGGGRLSQGQQKLIYSALAMASWECLSEGGQKPVIMLDDVAAELDDNNRGLLMGMVQATGAQSLVTGVLKGDVERLAAGPMFHVDQGVVSN
ncbi:DNA replication and repair protein RecF [Candidatus Comchoanobacter bicostacola]|uniref:DNA replication and repair protein RecF n=1 Tax=Candidatus Comchoanobacter bicostacola TaxID=2919598 RepID=A0ABY5DL25_9GAMM|nr:DNA replication and repair protein RecF [Candidatus Comchoanobacter bicostacola]UTC24579.1 DNA replication and repair protein RecF [Candidatus Comchoanobacter bicostacola]